MTDVVLREATAADAPQVLAVIQAAFGEYYERLDPPSGAHKETIEDIRKKMAWAQTVVAVLGETVIGCVFYEEGDGYLNFFRLAVAPTYQRRGVARRLIDYVEAQARVQGKPRVRLGVRIALPRLHAYYQRLGYQVLHYRSHPGYTEPTYMIMEKTLPTVPSAKGN
jgi:predicted N-acetyltransferase YhbS